MVSGNELMRSPSRRECDAAWSYILQVVDNAIVLGAVPQTLPKAGVGMIRDPDVSVGY
jgi:hypothetical protein